MAALNKFRRGKSVRERIFDRTFILFGKSCSGKSTLGNLLLGYKHFKAHEYSEATGFTKKVESKETKIEARQVYDARDDVKEMLNIQIIDQPGSDDGDFREEKYCEFLKKCIAESKAEMTATFLILIDLISSFFSPEQFLTLLNLAEILSDSCYSFFPNAIIVFTHADMIDEHLNEGVLEQKLEEKLQEENYACIQELINLVDGRYIFINGMNNIEINRIEILKKLFKLTRPNLNVYINGNNGFKASELKKFFGEDIRTDRFKRSLLKYDVEYNFNPDLNIFRKLDIEDLEENIANALDKLSGISKGISAMVLLINLEEMFNREIYNLIINLPQTYNLGENFKKDFWNYACIVYKVPVDNEDFVKRNVDGNRLLKMLAINVNSRYTWVTKRTSPDECSEKLTNLVRRVKQDTEGKTYTDGIVLAEMRQTIKESAKFRNVLGKAKMTDGIKREDLCGYIPFFELKSDSKVLVASNDFFWGKETISPLIGYFILKNINSNMAEQFRKEYPDKGGTIPTEQYTQYCLKAMKTL